MIKVEFEHNFQQKIMFQRFQPDSTCQSPKDIQEWRSAWAKELSSWHSPYKVLVDVTHLSLEDDTQIKTALDLMQRFFQGFFLKKIVGFGLKDHAHHEILPFGVFQTREEAEADLGVRLPKIRDPQDFRSAITLQNFFQQHCIELSFHSKTTLESTQQINILRDKITNNLMQWHSKWTLIVDCSNLEVSSEAYLSLERLLKYLGGLFMKRAVGYAPLGKSETYPFPVFRSRHRAVADISSEGTSGGDEAECRTKK